MTIHVQGPRGTISIGPGCSTFIVAEMSCNHQQNYEKALQIIDAAADAGADAIKLQTFTPDSLTIDCNDPIFQITENDAWKGRTLYQLYQQAYTPWEWHPKLKAHAESKGLFFFSTPFDEKAVDFLQSLSVNLYKAASFMTENLPLLEYIGNTEKPVIMSRGLTSIVDLQLAIDTLRHAGCPQIAVLHCISGYPATPDQMNLRTIPDITERFGVLAGLSDHTLGSTCSLTAAALGACIIEKHLTIRRSDGSLDAEYSLEPHEFKQMVQEIRIAEAALGHVNYQADKKEKQFRKYKQSLFVVQDIRAGEALTKENIRIIRPNNGLAPRHIYDVLGKHASRDIKRGTPLSWDLIQNHSR